MIALQAHAQGVVVPLSVRAGAPRSELSGVHAGMLRVRVTQAPEKGKANAAVVTLLSEALAIPKSRLEILSGATSTKKRVLVHGVDVDELREKLAAWDVD